jgi:hypothetical protein
MKELGSYLNDHMAGSVAALELLENLIKAQAGKPLEKFFRDLRDEVSADQEVVKTLVRRFARESTLRQAIGWMAEKFNRVKLRLAGEKAGELGLVEALEILVLGITGKQLLWRALSASLGDSPLLRGIDLSQLEQRAIDQSERVEAHRLEAARKAFLKV